MQSYTPGVPEEINADAYSSLIDILERSFKNYHDHPAFYNFGKTLTYGELDQLTLAFAAYLQQELKLEKGSRLAIMMPNCLQYPVSLFGALRAGLIVVNVNPLYTAHELKYQLNDCGAETIIVLENYAGTVQKVLPELTSLKNIVITRLGDLLPTIKGWLINMISAFIFKKITNVTSQRLIKFKDILRNGKKLTFKPVEFKNTDVAFLQYTGGTTGVAKGAMLTHRNLIANLEQADAWFNSILKKDHEIIITALPLYHIFSLTANCLYFSKIGGLNVLITDPRDIPDLLHQMSKFKFTAITGVNTLFNAMLHSPQFAKLDFSHCHLALGGGMAVQRSVAEKWQEITKSPLLEAYGLTETSPCVAINPAHLSSYNGSIGLPVSSTDIRILDEEGNEVPVGGAGELVIKGPQVMQGYWHQSKEVGEVFTSDGWLLTGDIVAMDEKGFLRLLERKKDMILVSGFNVYPKEIEDVLASHPGVREVAVIAVSDEHSGEVPKAFIVKENPNLTVEEVLSFARANLTAYKIPKSIQFVNDLPKSNVGKILRRALREGKH